MMGYYCIGWKIFSLSESYYRKLSIHIERFIANQKTTSSGRGQRPSGFA